MECAEWVEWEAGPPRDRRGVDMDEPERASGERAAIGLRVGPAVAGDEGSAGPEEPEEPEEGPDAH